MLIDENVIYWIHNKHFKGKIENKNLYPIKKYNNNIGLQIHVRWINYKSDTNDAYAKISM